MLPVIQRRFSAYFSANSKRGIPNLRATEFVLFVYKKMATSQYFSGTIRIIEV
jgi:hypothetical protein